MVGGMCTMSADRRAFVADDTLAARPCAKLASAVVVSMLAVAGCGGRSAASGVRVPDSVIAQLTAIARRAAVANGDSHPE